MASSPSVYLIFPLYEDAPPPKRQPQVTAAARKRVKAQGPLIIMNVMIVEELKGGERRMEFEKYVDDYTKVWERVNDNDDALAILAETAKDQRQSLIRGRKSRGGKATVKQLEYLQSLGVEVKPGLSRAEASRLIDGTKKRS